MSPKAPLPRISITIPAELVRKADQLARRWHRSRSWVIAEAMRRLSDAASPAGSPMGVAEPAPPGYAAIEIAEARRQHLQADLERSPAERLRRAEELVGLARSVAPRPRRRQIIAFDTLEDFYQWKKARRAGA